MATPDDGGYVGRHRHLFITPLRLLDRCSQCSAQAFVRTFDNITGEWLWCSHHYNQNEKRLARFPGFEFQDERWKLNKKPSSSARADWGSVAH